MVARQYNDNEFATVKKKAKVPVDHEAMKYGYIDMGNINKEEASMGEYSWTDGAKFYGSDPNIPW